VRERGKQDLEAGRVALEIDGLRSRARVEGADKNTYAVGLDWSQVEAKRALHAFCECRRFAAGKPCEHIWATLLAIAGSGQDVQPPGRDRVSLRKDRASAWNDLEVSPEALAVAVAVEEAPPRRRAPKRGRSNGGPRHPSTSWRSQLDLLRAEVGRLSSPVVTAPTAAEAAVSTRFLVNTAASRSNDGLVLDVFTRRLGPGGKPGKLKRTGVEPEALSRLLLPKGAPAESNGELAVITALATAAKTRQSRARRGKQKNTRLQRFRLPRRLHEPVLSHLASAGALGSWDGRRLSDEDTLVWDNGRSWRLSLRLAAAAGGAKLAGSLERNGDSVPLSAPLLILATDTAGRSLIIFAESIGRLSATESELHWINLLRDAREIVIPERDLEDALTELLEIPGLPRLEIPDELRAAEETSPPRPRLVLTKDAASVLPNAPLLAELSFLYGELEISARDARPTVIEWPGPTLLRRDMDREHELLVRLLEAGVEPVPGSREHELELRPQQVPAAAEVLLMEGWELEVSGASLRAPNPPTLRIESGIDWFELAGGLEFAGNEVELKKVLEAVRKGERFVTLTDGSQGLLPSSWSETYGSLAQLAHGEGEDGLRFLPSQAMLVDALLVEMPPAAVDKAFAELRDKLRSFERIKPKKEPRGFGGTLRGYQREGLGWLDFLRQFGLGGVLADDMGLGKTVQLLALLRLHRTPSKTTGLPSLVVVPRSLLYNWLEEAARFTPSLKVVEYGGPGREALQGKLGKYDLVLTTYGTMRRDIGFLATVEFDTVVLDEAQAIKNRESQAAKASRLLNGRHRLALTGTPIENHLGELGSLFEFLNPGLLGRLPLLEVLSSGRAAGAEELAKVAEGIRPFILRRTKAQVLPDLPPKTEQVLHCTLNPKQRELYDQLRAGYQTTLLRQAESEGVSGTAIQVLEALLRLRQVACHPGLVNEEWEEAGSAKLDTLFDLVDEVLDEGHKVLVFSQFTKLLAFVRQRVEERRIDYAYLDGKTRKRGEVVDRFQNDPSCNLFLISLKAGGVGLNLTAAGYVFLLDPWWNPAVEAQAIDRTHRIGQSQPVFAYRMIAQDTVEEKILELQSSKRKVADAILGGEGGPLRELTADDLRMLLS
jgi:superfamily II DNA or RNA helicase